MSRVIHPKYLYALNKKTHIYHYLWFDCGRIPSKGDNRKDYVNLDDLMRDDINARPCGSCRQKQEAENRKKVNSNSQKEAK